MTSSDKVFLTSFPPVHTPHWYISDIPEMYYSWGNGFNGRYGYFSGGDGVGVYDHLITGNRGRRSNYRLTEVGDGASYEMMINHHLHGNNND